MESDRIAKRVYVGECAGSRSVGRPRKRWIDTVKECLSKRSLDVKAVRGMGQGLSDSYVVLCKVRLVGTWIKRREVVAGAIWIRSEKLKEDWY